MKTEQEQIDEMIKIFTDNREVCHHMRCVECKYHGDKECMYSSYAYSLYQAGYGDVTEYKNRFEVADKVLTETREKLTKAEHDRDRYKAEIERLKAGTKQAKIDVLNELKEKCKFDGHTVAVYKNDIDELIKEIEKGGESGRHDRHFTPNDNKLEIIVVKELQEVEK